MLTKKEGIEVALLRQDVVLVLRDGMRMSACQIATDVNQGRTTTLTTLFFRLILAKA